MFEDFLEYDPEEDFSSEDDSDTVFSGSSEALPERFPPPLECISEELLKTVLKPPLQLSTFTCPITQTIFLNPVVAADGHTYEFGAISKWLTCRDTSPTTGQTIEYTELAPNLLLRALLGDLIVLAKQSI